jgi:hypothetical protein
VLRLDSANICYGVLGAHYKWVQDESVLILLDLADHVGLLLRSAIVVDNADTAEESHEDGHLGLGDGVHGRGHERQLQRDALGNLGIEGDFMGSEANVAGQDKEVVVTAGILISTSFAGERAFTNARQTTSLVGIQ